MWMVPYINGAWIYVNLMGYNSGLNSIGVMASISDANISLIQIMNKITNIPMMGLNRVK